MMETKTLKKILWGEPMSSPEDEPNLGFLPLLRSGKFDQEAFEKILKYFTAAKAEYPEKIWNDIGAIAVLTALIAEYRPLPDPVEDEKAADACCLIEELFDSDLIAYQEME